MLRIQSAPCATYLLFAIAMSLINRFDCVDTSITIPTISTILPVGSKVIKTNYGYY